MAKKSKIYAISGVAMVSMVAIGKIIRDAGVRLQVILCGSPIILCDLCG